MTVHVGINDSSRTIYPETTGGIEGIKLPLNKITKTIAAQSVHVVSTVTNKFHEIPPHRHKHHITAKMKLNDEAVFQAMEAGLGRPHPIINFTDIIMD